MELRFREKKIFFQFLERSSYGGKELLLEGREIVQLKEFKLRGAGPLAAPSPPGFRLSSVDLNRSLGGLGNL